MDGKRLLMYAHDSFGIGHIRRAQRIADYLASVYKDLSILIITGSPCLSIFPSARSYDYIKLPSVVADHSDPQKTDYKSQISSLDYKRICNIRESMILSIAKSYKPHVFFSDIAIGGIGGELVKTLQWLKSQTPHSKRVIGFRDVIDVPEITIEKWRSRGLYEILDTYYDRILIYGLKSVFDFCNLYQIPYETQEKVVYCGYLVPRCLEHAGNIRSRYGILENENLIVGMVGGGIDGGERIRLLLDCAMRMPEMKFIIVLGPFMPDHVREDIKFSYHDCRNVTIEDYVPTEESMKLLCTANVVVTMGGYNSVCEVLGTRKPAIIIPRSSIEKEQLLRATRFADLGLLSMLPESGSVEDLCNMISLAKFPESGSAIARELLTGSGLESIKSEIAELCFDIELH